MYMPLPWETCLSFHVNTCWDNWWLTLPGYSNAMVVYIMNAAMYLTHLNLKYISPYLLTHHCNECPICKVRTLPSSRNQAIHTYAKQPQLNINVNQVEIDTLC